MSIKVRSVTDIICDQCDKKLTNIKVWWRIVVKRNFSGDKDFCSKECATKWRDLNYYPSKYDPEEIDRVNRGD